MLSKMVKKEGGFTLIELLIVVVIIGILAAVAVPMYSRYMTTAKAAEAPTQLRALAEYIQSYIQAHPSNYSAAGMLLTNDCNETNCGGGVDWFNDLVSADIYYFDYTFTVGTLQLQAVGANGANGKATDFDGNDNMTVTVDPVNTGLTWAAAGKLRDVMP